MAYGDRYEPDGTAHHGGMGSVIVCNDPNLDRKVAIKFLQPGCEKRRIFDEVRALQRIRSKHVVQVFDIVIVPPTNQVGIVQEFLSGSDLSTFHQTAATPDAYLRVLYQLAKGLEDIHDQRLIHRDIKPKNAKRDQENIVKIFDFGLSRPNEVDAQTEGFVGTRGFAAPELCRNGSVRFTPAVDVYAFAATALYLARGRLPSEFLADPPNAEAWTNSRGFATLTLQTPSEVSTLLNTALATNPTSRPTMKQIRSSIERHLVQGQHRALVVNSNQTHVIHQGRPTVTLSKPGAGALAITYDGLFFVASNVQGDVFINNASVQNGFRIPASCVITIGAPALKNRRSFITMDISNPEVVL
jgi:eukaryotic-like serine/threonine-protein kinase